MYSGIIQVFVILHVPLGVVIKELSLLPFYFYVWYHLVRIWIMMKTLLVELASYYFCKSEFNGFVINKVFAYLNNAVGFVLVLYTIKYYFVVL